MTPVLSTGTVLLLLFFSSLLFYHLPSSFQQPLPSLLRHCTFLLRCVSWNDIVTDSSIPAILVPVRLEAMPPEQPPTGQTEDPNEIRITPAAVESPKRSKTTKKSKTKPKKSSSKHNKSLDHDHDHDHADDDNKNSSSHAQLLVKTAPDSRSHPESSFSSSSSSTSTGRKKGSTVDEGMKSMEPPPRQGSSSSSSEVILPAQPKPIRRTQSFIQSLPVAVAEPETTRIASVLAYTCEVEPITDSGRLVADATSTGKNNNDNDNNTADSDGRSRPALISVKIPKLSAGVKLGISFRSIFGELKISKIAPTSPLASTPLRPGDRLISLDHHRNTNHWTAVQAVNYIRNAEGMICFVVRTRNGDSNVAEAAVYKSSEEAKLGISFRNENGRLRISKINKNGLLGEMSVLHPGDFVESINSVDTSQLDAALALQIVRSSLGLTIFRVKNTDTTEVSIRDVMTTHLSSSRFSGPIVAADELENIDFGSGHLGRENSEFQLRPGFISVIVYKPTVDTKLGISFMNPDGNQLQVCNVSSNGMLSRSPLVPGMNFQSIGNIRCSKWTKQQALDYLKAAIGEILFVLQDPLGDSSYAVAMAYKPTPRSKLGISFKTTGGPLRIGHIQQDGLLCNSVVNCDDNVIAINNIPCQHLTPSEAVAITQRNPDSVTLLTKPYRSNGIVLSHLSSMYGGDEYDNVQRDIESADRRVKDESCKSCFGVIFGVIFIVILVVTLGADRCDPNDYYC